MSKCQKSYCETLDNLLNEIRSLFTDELNKSFSATNEFDADLHFEKGNFDE